MKFVIANETDSKLDVSWGRIIGVRQAHQGFIDAHEQVAATDLGHEVVPVEGGEKVWVRGISDDGRVVATTLVIDPAKENIARLSSKTAQLTEELTLPEEVLELALDDNGHLKGVTRPHLEMALFMGALFELEERGRLMLTANSAELKSTIPTGDRVLDRALSELVVSDQPLDLAEILLSISITPGPYYETTVAALVAKGILHAEEAKLMWLIPSWVLRPSNTVPENHLVHKLQKVLALGLPADRRTDALITIISCCFDSHRFLNQELMADVEQRMYEISHQNIPSLGLVRQTVAEAMSRKAMIYAAYPGVPST